MLLTQWNLVHTEGSMEAILVVGQKDKIVVPSIGESGATQYFSPRCVVMESAWLMHPMVLAYEQNAAPAVKRDLRLPFENGQVKVSVTWRDETSEESGSVLSQIKSSQTGVAFLGEIIAVLMSLAEELSLRPSFARINAVRQCCDIQLQAPNTANWTDWVDRLLLFSAGVDMIAHSRGFLATECLLSVGDGQTLNINGTIFDQLSSGNFS